MGYKKRLGQIRTIQGIYQNHVEENFPEAKKSFEEALVISEEANDLFSNFFVSFWFGGALMLDGQFEEAARHYQKALDISVLGGNPWAIASMKGNFAIFCNTMGQVSRGFQISAEAVQVAEKCGDPLAKGIAYTSHGFSCYGKGLFEEAEDHFFKAISLLEKLEEKMINLTAHSLLVHIFLDRDDLLKAEEWCEKWNRLLKNSGYLSSLLGLVEIVLLRTKGIVNPKDIDLESLYVQSRNIKPKIFQPMISSIIGVVLMNLDGHLSEAETWIQKAIEEDQRNGTRFSLGRDYALYAEWHKRKGDRPWPGKRWGRP